MEAKITDLQVAFDSVLYYYQSKGQIYRPANIPEKVFSREIEYYRYVSSLVHLYVLVQMY